MITPRAKLKKQWKLQNQATQEQLTKMPGAEERRRKELYADGKEKTGIMQLVARHSEMPAELGLNRSDRGDLAKITPEYTPGKCSR